MDYITTNRKEAMKLKRRGFDYVSCRLDSTRWQYRFKDSIELEQARKEIE